MKPIQASELLGNCRHLTLAGIDADGNLEWIGTSLMWNQAREEEEKIFNDYEFRKI